jgi:adenosylmethionine-8-amino-7-oxononanoate aminotransferase
MKHAEDVNDESDHIPSTSCWRIATRCRTGMVWKAKAQFEQAQSQTVCCVILEQCMWNGIGGLFIYQEGLHHREG